MLKKDFYSNNVCRVRNAYIIIYSIKLIYVLFIDYRVYCRSIIYYIYYIYFILSLSQKLKPQDS